MKYFIFDPLWPKLLSKENEAQLQASEINYQVFTKKFDIQNLEEIKNYSGDKIIGINPDYVDWSFPADSFKEVKNLKGIITQSTSYGWIDIDYAIKNDIAVMNTRNFSTNSVAEWAVMMMFNLARKTPELIKNDFPLNYDSDFETYKGLTLSNKKVGIIGLGNIGRAIAEKCHALGMNIHYWNRTSKDTTYHASNIQDIFQTCDIIFPCVADNDDTKNLIGDDVLLSMKKNALLISVIHHAYNHETALKLTENNKIWGYGFEDKANSFDNYKGNVWAAPAYAWCTNESLRKAMDQFVDIIVASSNGDYKKKVN